MYEYGGVDAEVRGASGSRRRPARMPTATVRLAPNRALSRGVSGATMIMIGAIGSSRSAAPSGRVAEDELEVLRDEEHHAEHGQEHEDHAAGARAEAPGLRK